MSHARRAGLGAAATVGVVLLACGCGQVVVPKSFDKFNARDGVVQLKSPAGWTRNGGGGKKFYNCEFTSGPAKIRIETDLSGSLLGDIAGAAAQGMGDDLPEELSPVAQVHEHSLELASLDLGEMDVKATETIQTGFGETRRSEFTASGSLGSTTHGYLVTALGQDKRIRVTCTCPEKHWEKLQPAFDEVIKSLARGIRE